MFKFQSIPLTATTPQVDCEEKPLCVLLDPKVHAQRRFPLPWLRSAAPTSGAGSLVSPPAALLPGECPLQQARLETQRGWPTLVEGQGLCLGMPPLSGPCSLKPLSSLKGHL